MKPEIVSVHIHNCICTFATIKIIEEIFHKRKILFQIENVVA